MEAERGLKQVSQCHTVYTNKTTRNSQLTVHYSIPAEIIIPNASRVGDHITRRRAAQRTPRAMTSRRSSHIIMTSPPRVAATPLSHRRLPQKILIAIITSKRWWRQRKVVCRGSGSGGRGRWRRKRRRRRQQSSRTHTHTHNNSTCSHLSTESFKPRRRRTMFCTPQPFMFEVSAIRRWQQLPGHHDGWLRRHAVPQRAVASHDGRCPSAEKFIITGRRRLHWRGFRCEQWRMGRIRDPSPAVHSPLQLPKLGLAPRLLRTAARCCSTTTVCQKIDDAVPSAVRAANLSDQSRQDACGNTTTVTDLLAPLGQLRWRLPPAIWRKWVGPTLEQHLDL